MPFCIMTVARGLLGPSDPNGVSHCPLKAPDHEDPAMLEVACKEPLFVTELPV